MRKWMILLLALLAISSSIGYGVWHRSSRNAELALASGPLAHLPDYVQKANLEVQAAYQFAIDNPEILKQIPCYCGCAKTLGHKHNLACYITAYKPDGSVAQFTDHAVYCTVCLDITQVVMTMVKDGKAIQEIQLTINKRYAQPAS